MKTLCNCLDLVCHILKLTPGISTTLEAKCLREPANDPAEVRVTDKQKGTPNLELCRMLIETFIELSRVSAPPLETLSIIIDALRAVAISEFENCEKNAVIMALKMISIDRYGMVNIYTHPLFLNINKLQISERDANNYSTSVSLLSFCIEIISNDYFVIEFPVDSSGLIGETLKFVISEIIPECFDYPDVYRWKSASLSFEFLTEIFKKFDKFAYPQAIFVNPLLDLITAQLNKIDIAEFIINCLQVKVKNELNEISYENVHLSKEFESNNDPEILRGIKTMIFNALRALDEIVTLILYSERIGKESGFENVQLVKDIRGTLYQNLGDEESLPLITALMSYVAFQMKKCPINDDDEFWAIPSLSMLTKIVMIYGNSPQKPALEHFLTGNYKQAKDDFVSYFWICFSNKSVNLPHDNKIKLTKAYLEFLIISLPLQKSFSTSILTAENFVLEFKSIINSYVDFKKDEMIGYETMEQLFHYVTLYEEIINN